MKRFVRRMFCDPLAACGAEFSSLSALSSTSVTGPGMSCIPSDGEAKLDKGVVVAEDD